MPFHTFPNPSVPPERTSTSAAHVDIDGSLSQATLCAFIGEGEDCQYTEQNFIIIICSYAKWAISDQILSDNNSSAHAGSYVPGQDTDAQVAPGVS